MSGSSRCFAASGSLPAKGASADIPPKQNRKDPICFSASPYRARNPIESFNNVGVSRRLRANGSAR
jgi:hypothetical protein